MNKNQQTNEIFLAFLGTSNRWKAKINIEVEKLQW